MKRILPTETFTLRNRRANSVPARSKFLPAAKHLKQSMPEIPIILFTMYDLGQDRARDFGVDAVVSKPEGLGQLSHEVESLLTRH